MQRGRPQLLRPRGWRLQLALLGVGVVLCGLVSRAAFALTNLGQAQHAPMIPISTGSKQVYFNLTCPFEMSKYSCVRQGSMARAMNALNFAWQGANLERAQDAVVTASRGAFRGRRVVIVGDSLSRQVFISLGCILGRYVAASHINWERSWPCGGTRHCLGSGAHSGFHTAWFRLLDGGEVHFVPIAGARGAAGAKNATAAAALVPDPDLVLRLVAEHAAGHGVGFGAVLEAAPGSGSAATLGPASSGPASSEPASGPGPRLALGPADVVVLNAGIHHADLGAHCRRVAEAARLGRALAGDPLAPHLLYMKVRARGTVLA